jgi:hypothetical protein
MVVTLGRERETVGKSILRNRSACSTQAFGCVFSVSHFFKSKMTRDDVEKSKKQSSKKRKDDDDDSDDESDEYCAELIKFFCAKYVAYTIMLTFFVFVVLFSLYLLGLLRL